MKRLYPTLHTAGGLCEPHLHVFHSLPKPSSALANLLLDSPLAVRISWGRGDKVIQQPLFQSVSQVHKDSETRTFILKEAMWLPQTCCRTDHQSIPTSRVLRWPTFRSDMQSCSAQIAPGPFHSSLWTREKPKPRQVRDLAR